MSDEKPVGAYWVSAQDQARNVKRMRELVRNAMNANAQWADAMNTHGASSKESNLAGAKARESEGWLLAAIDGIIKSNAETTLELQKQVVDLKSELGYMRRMANKRREQFALMKSAVKTFGELFEGMFNDERK